MELLKQLQEELNDIENIKKENINLKADKKTMSETLYSMMMDKYRESTYEQRVENYKEGWCSCCRFRGCEFGLPEDILLPVKSDKDWIPATKGCKKFEWS